MERCRNSTILLPSVLKTVGFITSVDGKNPAPLVMPETVLKVV